MEKKDTAGVVELVYNTLLITLTVAMFAVVSYNVFMRFVLNRSVGWADELARFLFIWLSFLGAAIAYRHNDHVGLGFFVELIRSDAVRRVIYFFQQLCILFVLGFLSYFGVLAARTARNVSPALGIRMSIIYYIVPVVSIMMVVLGLIKLMDLLRGKAPDTTDHLVEEALEEFAPERMKEQ